MPSSTALRFARAGLSLLAAATFLSPTPSRAADTWPSRVVASYEVNFNGINVGTYDFSSTQEGATYKLASQARLSLLLGAFQWSGNTQSSGRIAGDAVKPNAFEFDFKAQSKTGSTVMNFTDDTVTQVLHNPMPKDREGIVPVQTQHLKGVLDPLTAVMAMSRGTSGNPCGRRIPIYDGHQRFDLLLSPKGQVQLEARSAAGQPGVGYVCRIRYIPIAGYKPDDGTKYMAQNNDIEIILRPVPGANIFIPHQLTIPTIAGNATLVSRRVTVTTNSQQQIALVN